MTGIPGTVGRPGWRMPPRRASAPWLDALAVPALVLRTLPFLALAILAAAHWTALVEPHQTRRALVAALIVTGGGILINLSAALPRAFGIAVRIGLVVLMALLAVRAIGIPMKLLMPAGWDTLHDRVSGGLSVVGSVSEWPYKGPNVWLRLTTLLALPLVLVPASVLTFWPRRGKPGAIYRAIPLVLLVGLYGVAVAARPFDQQTLRGLGLLACLAAWIWLPRLSGREARGAIIALVLVGAAAALVAPKLASKDPWVDYRHWSWTLHREKTIVFNCQPTYGPLHWPRKGTTLLLIKSRHPHYWKAESLDHFDGVGWGTSRDFDPTITQLQINGTRDWTDTARITVRGFRSQLVIAPGTPLTMHGLPSQTIVGSAATYLTGAELHSGNSYSVTSYTPDPTAKEMRAAQGVPDPVFARFTTLSLPDPKGSFLNVTVPLNTEPSTGDPDAGRVLADSSYAGVYSLAQRIARGAPTQYDVVRRVGSYLEANYEYVEKVPRHEFPLKTFLLTDKRGYCQHFAGAAALMLRMLGVPTRVVSGFAPGTRNSETHEFVVRDLDAHSWIEVWFAGIGWVPFDPTPAQAPAASQAASFAAFSEIASAARGDFKDTPTKPKREPNAVSSAGGGRKATDEGHTPWGWVIAGVLFGLLALTAVIVSVSRLRMRRRPMPDPCGDAEIDHLVRLLVRLGLDVPPQTTLLELEQRMERLGGPEAAGYAERLRRRRYGTGDEPAPGRAERRKLRQLLAAAAGAGLLSRLQLAMPDNLVTRSAPTWVPRIRRTK